MSKSTPLNQLRKNDETLVQDILQEIESNSPHNNGRFEQPSMMLPPMNSTEKPPPPTNNVNMNNNVEVDDKRIVSFIPSKYHSPIYISLIVMVLIHPRIRTLLFSLIPDKSPFLKHKDNLFILMTGVIAGLLFHFGRDFLP
jgi:uncharacterized protein YhhL (DUF1145 family)